MAILIEDDQLSNKRMHKKFYKNGFKIKNEAKMYNSTTISHFVNSL